MAKFPPDASADRTSDARRTADYRRIRTTPAPQQDAVSEYLHSDKVHSPQKGDIDLPAGFKRTDSRNPKK